MSLIDTLLEIEENINLTSDFRPNQKIILFNLIAKEKKEQLSSRNPFDYFFKDVTKLVQIFDFSNALSLEEWNLANDSAKACLNIFIEFESIEANSKLLNWLNMALKITDIIGLNYLQKVLKQSPTFQGDLGKERSVYAQITKKGNKGEKAGRIMNNLYEKRNKMEHRTINDSQNPGYKKIVTPDYTGAKKLIKNSFPDALKCFNLAFELESGIL